MGCQVWTNHKRDHTYFFFELSIMKQIIYFAILNVINILFRCLKYNALAIQLMMKEKFNDPVLAEIRDTFKFR